MITITEETSNIIAGYSNEITYSLLLATIVTLFVFSWWSTYVNNREVHESIHRESQSANSTSQSTHQQSATNTDEDHQTNARTSSASEESSGTRFMVKLKFLNDEVRQVHAYSNELIEQFRRRAFQSETDQRSRLIYGGQLLKDDKTLFYYNIKPNQENNEGIPVIHVVPPPRTQPATNESSDDDVNNDDVSASIGINLPSASLVFIVLFGLTLLMCWLLMYYQPHLFTLPSTVNIILLSCFWTALFINHVTPPITSAQNQSNLL